jgi:hypothetical protein
VSRCGNTRAHCRRRSECLEQDHRLLAKAVEVAGEQVGQQLLRLGPLLVVTVDGTTTLTTLTVRLRAALASMAV